MTLDSQKPHHPYRRRRLMLGLSAVALATWTLAAACSMEPLDETTPTGVTTSAGAGTGGPPGTGTGTGSTGTGTAEEYGGAGQGAFTPGGVGGAGGAGGGVVGGGGSGGALERKPMRIVRWSEPGSSEARFGLWIDDMIADAGTAEELGLPPGSGAEALLERGHSGLTDLETRAVTRTSISSRSIRRERSTRPRACPRPATLPTSTGSGRCSTRSPRRPPTSSTPA